MQCAKSFRKFACLVIFYITPYLYFCILHFIIYMHFTKLVFCFAMLSRGVGLNIGEPLLLERLYILEINQHSISSGRESPQHLSEKQYYTFMMFLLFSQTSLAQTKDKVYFWCITCFSHPALITCSTRLEGFEWLSLSYIPQKVKVNLISHKKWKSTLYPTESESQPQNKNARYKRMKGILTINFLPNFLEKRSVLYILRVFVFLWLFVFTYMYLYSYLLQERL